MKRFVQKSVLFLIMLALLLAALLYCLPNPVSEKNLLGAVKDKQQLLLHTKSPRIIFIGGSNLSFGLDSKRIIDSFHVPVINMGIHGGLGLKFMIDEVRPYIRTGDILVVTPEYEHFYGDGFWGSIELVSVIFDTYPEGKKFIDPEQWTHLIGFIPKYAASKILYIAQDRFVASKSVYSRKSFNQFGDAVAHWDLPPEHINSQPKNTGKEQVQKNVLTFLRTFEAYANQRGAKMVLLPPAFQHSSFNNQAYIIGKINASLRNEQIPFSAAPSRYQLADSLFFNTIYHLNKKGVDVRTGLVIEDLKKILR